MSITIIVAIIGVCSAVAVAALTAFYSISSTKKKTAAETEELRVRAEGEVLANLKASQSILKEMLQPLENEVLRLKNEIEKMKPFICKVQNCPNRK